MKSKHFQLKLIDSVKNVFIVTAVFPDYEWKDGKVFSETGWDVEALMDNLGTENPGGLDISVIVQNQLTGNTPGK